MEEDKFCKNVFATPLLQTQTHTLFTFLLFIGTIFSLGCDA